MVNKADPSLLEQESLPWFERVLAEALAKTQAREEGLPALSPLSDSVAGRLDKAGQKIRNFPAFADAPRPKVAEVDNLFQNGEVELRQYLAAVESLRQKMTGHFEVSNS